MVFDPTLYSPENLDEGPNSFSEETPHLHRVTLATFGLFGIPETLLDVGCGLGQTIDIARKVGVDAKGIEFYDRSNRPEIIKHDLRQPLSSVFPGGADMVFCWEVAEHLPEESAYMLGRSLADNLKTGGLLIFTAAIPGQGGLGHINCQIPWYWMNMFGRVGLERNVQATAALAFLWEFAAGQYMYHLRQNLTVFNKV